MAKHLSDRDILRVVELLDGWKNKLTWEALCQACESVIGTTPARQTLAKVVRIENAFEACKVRLKSGVKDLNLPPSMKIAAERIARLENENERLKRENNELLQQFVTWQYNAYSRGMSAVDLNRPLPSIDRGQTD